MTEPPEIVYTVLARLYRHIMAGPSLPADCDPVTLAESPDGLDITLTPLQGLLLDLIGRSRDNPDGLLIDDPNLHGELKRLLGLADKPPRLWLPPDASVETFSDRVRIRFGSPITAFLCVAGRRSGKTMLASILLAWLAWRILKDEEFLDGLTLLPNSTISLLNVACDRYQARILFRMLLNHLRDIDILPSGAEYTERVPIGPGGRVLIESLTSSARSARGRTACAACFDEFAHFQRTTGPLADRAMWLALLPSLATFGRKALAIVTTSPAGRSGFAWELFQQRGKRDGMLTVQLPTWELNPHVSREALREEFERDEMLAKQEYGAEFIAPDGRFLRAEDIRACVVPAPLSPPSACTRPHLHVDLGLIRDATAMALGYFEPVPPSDDPQPHSPAPSFRIVIQRVDVLQGSPEQPLRAGDIEKRILELAEDAPLGGVTFDQHESAYLIERLEAAGLPARVFRATERSNRETYGFLRDLIVARRIILPDHDRLLAELEALVCESTPRGFRVEAPPDGTDDCVDAVAVCAWCLAHDANAGWLDMLDVVEPL